MKRIFSCLFILVCLGSMVIESYASGDLQLEQYLVAEIENHTSRIDLSRYEIPKEDLVEVIMRILNRHPELFYVSNNIMAYSNPSQNKITSIEMTYLDYTQEEINQVYNEMKKPLDMLDDDMSTVEKLLFLHDYLVVHLEYAQENINSEKYHSIAGVALEGTAVCDGYARAFQYYMNELQVPCNIIGNSTHAWNQVQLDGKWYMIDVTHDDPVQDMYGRVSHKYFLKSESGMGNPTWYREDYSACDSKQYDNAFWNSTDTQIIYRKGSWYFIDEHSDFDIKLYKHNFEKDNLDVLGKEVMQFQARWYVYGDENSFWEGNYSRIAQYNDKLIYTTPTQIYWCDWNGKKKEGIVNVDVSKGYIYGMKLVDGMLIYQLSKAPMDEKVTRITFDMSSLQPKVNEVVKDSKSGASYVVTWVGKSGGTVAYKKNLKKMSTEIVIPDKIKIRGKPYKVTAIADKAFMNNKKLVKVVIPKGVTAIGKEAFRGCKRLKEMILPINVKEIGEKAFYGCKRLKKLTIRSKKLTSVNIGKEAFRGVSKKAVILVPAKKKTLYRKILRKKGIHKKAYIKAMLKGKLS